MIFPVQPVISTKVDVVFLDENYPKRLGLHNGWDINLKSGGNSDLGYPFRAIDDGEVVYCTDLAPNGSWGGLIVVWHEQLGIWSRYGHHNPKSARVKVGDKVKEGQVLAGIGRGRNNTFLAHLHMDIFRRIPLTWNKRPNYTYWAGNDLKGLLDTFLDPQKVFKKFNVEMP